MGLQVQRGLVNEAAAYDVLHYTELTPTVMVGGLLNNYFLQFI